MTPEDDKRISEEYGLTPELWRETLVSTGLFHEIHAPKQRIADVRHKQDARAMAKAKEMIALLERADVEICELLQQFGDEHANRWPPDILADIRALLERLKGGSHE